MAVLLFAVWTAATWFLEGRLLTLSRPEAVADRLVYVLVANLVIGILGAALVLRIALASGGTTLADTGFGSRRPSLPWIVVGFALGLALYFAQGAPANDPVVILNAYAQVFVVSVAEVLVCWAVVGAIAKGAIGGARSIATIGAAVVAAVLFGIYHFGHSPPFNTIGMVAFLAAIGLVTGAFFFVSRDTYATIAFHNFLGVYGVLQALAAGNRLDSLATPQVPLLGTAVVGLLILIAADVFIVRRAASPAVAHDVR